MASSTSTRTRKLGRVAGVSRFHATTQSTAGSPSQSGTSLGPLRQLTPEQPAEDGFVDVDLVPVQPGDAHTRSETGGRLGGDVLRRTPLYTRLEHMSDVDVSATAVVSAAARRCVELEGRGDVGSLLELTRAFEDLVVAAHVGQARVLARFFVHESGDFGHGTEVLPGPEAVTPQEIATVLEMSVESVRSRLAVADTLAAMPTLAAAAEAGRLRWWQVRRAVEAAWRLPTATRVALDSHLARMAAEGRLRNGFAAALSRLVIDLDPELTERLLADALAERAVVIRPDQDVAGIGRLSASLPAEGAVMVAAGLDRLADTALAQPPAGLPAEGRTADNRRADALVGLLACALDALDATDATDEGSGSAAATDSTGGAGASTVARGATAAADPAAAVVAAVRVATELPAGTVAGPDAAVGGARGGRRRGRSARIQVTVSAETLLGVREHAGHLDGWGPITPAHARRLAVIEGATWQRILTDPVSGSVLDIGRTRYAPTAAITDHVLTRDGGRCRRPGCHHRARDLDHAQPWDQGGTTAVGNLQAVCRSCHTAKHARGSGNPWSVTMDRGAPIIWRTPHGGRAATPAPDLRPADRMPPPPEPAERWTDDTRWQLRVAQTARSPGRRHLRTTASTTPTVLTPPTPGRVTRAGRSRVPRGGPESAPSSTGSRAGLCGP